MPTGLPQEPPPWAPATKDEKLPRSGVPALVLKVGSRFVGGSEAFVSQGVDKACGLRSLFFSWRSQPALP